MASYSGFRYYDDFNECYPVGSVYLTVLDIASPREVLYGSRWSRNSSERNAFETVEWLEIKDAFLFSAAVSGDAEDNADDNDLKSLADSKKLEENNYKGTETENFEYTSQGVSLDAANLPQHTHSFTPEGTIENTIVNHTHNISHTHTFDHTHKFEHVHKFEHTHDISHEHTYTPEGTVAATYPSDSDDGMMHMKHTADYTRTVSSVDGNIFISEDYGDKSYSTGEKNVWTDKKPQQKIKLIMSYLFNQIKYAFTGKQTTTSGSVKVDNSLENVTVTKDKVIEATSTTPEIKYTELVTTIKGMNTTNTGNPVTITKGADGTEIVGENVITTNQSSNTTSDSSVTEISAETQHTHNFTGTQGYTSEATDYNQVEFKVTTKVEPYRFQVHAWVRVK